MEKRNKSNSLAKAETLKADVVVIGAGASGLVAGIAAAEGGASVIMLEKMDMPGGPLSLPPEIKGPPGLFAVESRIQRKKYIGLTRDEAFKMIMDYSHWRANAQLVRAVVDQSASTIEWLEQYGSEYTAESPVTLFPGSLFTWHLLKGSSQNLAKTLVAKAEEKGAEIHLATPVKKILKNRDRVGGVIAEDRSGKGVQINAKAVIIATGGYANNKEMIKKHTGFDLGYNLFYANRYLQKPDVGLTGDGIQMAWEVGAAEEGMGVLILSLDLQGPGCIGTQLRAMARQPYLWVNQQGARFCNEETVKHWTFAGNAIAGQKGRYFFLIFDGNTKNYIEEEGLDHGFDFNLFPPTTKIVNLDAQIESCLAKGNENVFTANSLEELGNKIRVNPDGLKKTLNEYNKFCEKGHDDLFAKDPRFLHPVQQPKFYAFRLFPSFFATVGGIKINEKTEVLTKEYEAIPGLYAIGNDSNRLYGDTYDLWVPGSGLGFAMNSGRIAAENVLRYIGK
jgi:fumarate reductase flavoprotein subunit